MALPTGLCWLPMSQLFLFTLIPFVAAVVASILSVGFPPSARWRSIVQHFAAGVVFAAVAGEVLPGLVHAYHPILVSSGFSIGVVAMLALRWIAQRLERPDVAGRSSAARGTWSLVLVTGVDIFIDGVLIGVGFAADRKTGLLLTVALGIELTFLGLSLSAERISAGYHKTRTVALVTVVTSMIVIGSLFANLFLSDLSKNEMVVTLSFSAAVLIYLVTEELLIEAHEAPETPATTTTFFAGFLIVFLIEMVLSS